jgi:hypothetical protein
MLAAGNVVKLIPTQTITGEVFLDIQKGLRNFNEKTMNEFFTKKIRFVSLKPQVELIGNGVIVPNSEGILFPFRAVSLKAVDVKVIKIIEK